MIVALNQTYRKKPAPGAKKDQVGQYDEDEQRSDGLDNVDKVRAHAIKVPLDPPGLSGLRAILPTGFADIYPGARCDYSPRQRPH